MAVSTLIAMQISPENGDDEAYLGNKKMKWSANSHGSAIEGISRWHPIPSVLLLELLVKASPNVGRSVLRRPKDWSA
jgi:hypothetical protein